MSKKAKDAPPLLCGFGVVGALPKAVSAEQVATLASESGRPESVVRDWLRTAGITVAEPVEHRVTTEGLYNYWCACGWRYAHVGSGEPDEVAVAKHDAYVAESGEEP